MDKILIPVICAVVFLVIGIALGSFLRKKLAEGKIGSAENEAKRIVEDSKREAEEIKKEAESRKKEVLIEAKEEILSYEEFAKVKDLGLGSCQVCIWDTSLFTDENAAAIKACMEKYGITVSTLWAGWTGPCEWNFTGGPVTIGLVPAAYRAHRQRSGHILL